VGGRESVMAIKDPFKNWSKDLKKEAEKKTKPASRGVMDLKQVRLMLKKINKKNKGFN
jgi:hypothetical protein